MRHDEATIRSTLAAIEQTLRSAQHVDISLEIGTDQYEHGDYAYHRWLAERPNGTKTITIRVNGGAIFRDAEGRGRERWER